jgi:hypothetical protein
MSLQSIQRILSSGRNYLNTSFSSPSATSKLLVPPFSCSSRFFFSSQTETPVHSSLTSTDHPDDSGMYISFGVSGTQTKGGTPKAPKDPRDQKPETWDASFSSQNYADKSVEEKAKESNDKLHLHPNVRANTDQESG